MTLAPRTRRSHLLLAGLATLLITSVIAPANLQAAVAAPGDYTIAIAAPETVDVNSQFSEVITVSCPQGGCGVITLRQQLPPQLRMVSVPTGSNEVVQSVSGGSGLGATLQFRLNPIAEAKIVSFNVALTNDRTAQTTVSPDSIWDLQVTSGDLAATARVTPVGTVQPLIWKSQATIPASGNRTVTYTFRLRLEGNAAFPQDRAIGRFAAGHAQIVDTLPAGARVVGSNVGGLPGGAWSSVSNPDGSTTWTLTSAGQYAPSPNDITQTASLTVFYPESHFPNGSQPPLNEAQFTAVDRSGTTYGPGAASVQAPALDGGPGEAMWLGVEITRTSDGARLANGFENSYRFRGVVHDTTLEQRGAYGFVLSDDESSIFWEHTFASELVVSFNDAMQAADAPWQLQFRYSHDPGQWQTVAQGRTTAGSTVYPRVEGSAPINGTVVTRPNGTYMLGWRLLVSPQATDPVLHSSAMATIDMKYTYLWRNLATDSAPTGPIRNVLAITAFDAGTDEALTRRTHQDQRNIYDGQFTPVKVAAPASLTVGTADAIEVELAAQDDRPISACVATVLPTGVRWTGDAVTRVGGLQPLNQELPTIDTVTLSTAASGQDIVKVCFHGVLHPTVHGDAPLGWTSSVRLSIPVVALPTAFQPPASNTAKVEAFAIVTDPVALRPLGPNSQIYTDVHDVDPTRETVNASEDYLSVLSQGGLQLQKEISVDGGAQWALTAETHPGATVHWSVQVFNTLPSPATDIDVCDSLPFEDDQLGSTVALTLTGPVSVQPGAAQVLYSAEVADSCTAISDWHPDAAGARAFRVLVPVLDTGASLMLRYPTAVPDDAKPGSLAVNDARASAVVDAVSYSNLRSNVAQARISAPAINLLKEVAGSEGAPYANEAEVAVGGTAIWRITATNTGDVPLTDGRVVDASLGAEWRFERLEPGAQQTWIVEEADVTAGYTNVAIVTATSSFGDVSDAADASITTPASPSQQERDNVDASLSVTGAASIGALVVGGSSMALAGLMLRRRTQRA